MKVKRQLLELRRQTRAAQHGWTREKHQQAVEERMAKILVALQEGPKTLGELMELTGLKERTVKLYISRLRETGYYIVAFNEAKRGSRGAEKWLYMYVPTVGIL